MTQVIHGLTAEQMADNAQEAAEVLKLLAHEARLMMLCCLIDREMSVNELAEAINMRLPAVSQHLAKLRAAHIVATRREGQTIFYRADNELARRLVGTLCNFYG